MDLSSDATMWECGHRPDHCGSGRPVKISTNFVPLMKAPDVFYRYNVKFGLIAVKSLEGHTVPCAPSDFAEKNRILCALKDHDQQFAEKKYAVLHNCTVLFSLKPLEPRDANEICLEHVAYELRSGEKKVISSVKLVSDGEISYSNTSSDLVGSQSNPQASPERLAILNAFARHYPGSELDIVKAGAQRFFPLNEKPHFHKDLEPLMARSGFSLTVKATESGVGVNINVTIVCFLIHQTQQGRPILLSEVIDTLRKRFFSNLPKVESDIILSSLLRNLQVEVNLPTFRQADASFKKIRSLAGSVRAPSIIERESVLEFFKSKYDFDIRRTDLAPVQLVNRYFAMVEKIGWYPPEILAISPHQVVGPRFQQLFVSEIIKVATKGAMINRNRIQDTGLSSMGLLRIKDHQTDVGTLPDLGFHVQERLLESDARMLQAPKVFYSASNMAQPREASWNLRDVHRFYEAKNFQELTDLVVLRIHAPGTKEQSKILDGPKWKNFVNLLHGQMRYHGSLIKAQNISTEQLSHEMNRPTKFADDLKKIFEKLQERNPIILVCLPYDGKEPYETIQKQAVLHYGYRTVSMVYPKFRDGDKATVSNIVAKINIKLGGICHTPFRPDAIAPLNIPNLNNMIIMGADVIHPTNSADSAGCPSIAVVTGSSDSTFAKYWASMRAQKTRQEKIDNLRLMVAQRLYDWERTNQGCVPDGIVFYRDGVGDSQHEAVLDIEIPAIFAAWDDVKSFSSQKNLRLTLAVVNKKHSTRFYPSASASNKTPQTRGGNVMPGLLVDRDITHPYLFDFYLQSHAAIQGTARPAHYTVLRNDLRLDAHQMTGLTHWLCYSLGRATKGISYATPTFLADIGCTKASHWFSYRLGPVRGAHEDRDAYANRCLVKFLKDNPTWNGEDRPGPWHNKLDRTMFWT